MLQVGVHKLPLHVDKVLALPLIAGLVQGERGLCVVQVQGAVPGVLKEGLVALHKGIALRRHVVAYHGDACAQPAVAAVVGIMRHQRRMQCQRLCHVPEAQQHEVHRRLAVATDGFAVEGCAGPRGAL